MKTGRLEAILFDLDGVIINSFESWYQAFNTMLVKYRREKLTRDEFRATCWGPDLAHNLNALNLTDEAGQYCINEQLNLVELIELYPDAKTVLSRLRTGYKLKIGLVTNTPKKNVITILDYFQLFDSFDVIVTGDDVRTGKPDAEMILKACATLSVKPEHAILVGDTEIDLLAGKSAGCSIICVRAKSAGDACIENLQELFAVLDELKLK
jgi:HAD superfamily hydrolase (TIGR01509 family)